MTDSSLFCWKCQKKIFDLPMKIGFRATCMHCDADLHVCKNCRYYAVGKPNDCLVPGTDPISDRERSNLCEEFKPKTLVQEPKSMDKAKRLFGDDDIFKKKSFDDLFD